MRVCGAMCPRLTSPKTASFFPSKKVRLWGPACCGTHDSNIVGEMIAWVHQNFTDDKEGLEKLMMVIGFLMRMLRGFGIVGGNRSYKFAHNKVKHIRLK